MRDQAICVITTTATKEFYGGGIYVDSDTESDSGIPFLSDIPLLGWLFKSNSKTKSKSELLIFITPKILS